MGDSLTEQQAQTSPTPYGDTFDEMLPHYLVMGMSYEDYWEGEYGMKLACRKAFRIRMENEQRISDRNNWYMGQYMIRVLQCVPLLVGGLNVKESTRLPDYPEKPFMEQADEAKKEEVRKKKEEDQTRLAMAMLQAAFSKFNKNMEKKQKQEAQTGTGQ